MQKTDTGRLTLILLLMLTGSLWGCASTPNAGVFEPERQRFATMDGFGLLLRNAAVRTEDIPTGDTLNPSQMEDLTVQLRLKIANGSLETYGPCVLASYLLLEALKQDDSVSRAWLSERLGKLDALIVLNPVGHMVLAYSGELLNWVEPVRVINGVPRAGPYRLDAFYVREGAEYREAQGIQAPVFFQLPLSKPVKRFSSSQPTNWK